MRYRGSDEHNAVLYRRKGRFRNRFSARLSCDVDAAVDVALQPIISSGQRDLACPANENQLAPEQGKRLEIQGTARRFNPASRALLYPSL
jgi:hypothetical protein